MKVETSPKSLLFARGLIFYEKPEDRKISDTHRTDKRFRSGPDETRTRDLRHARAALSQLSYGPKKPLQS